MPEEPNHAWIVSVLTKHDRLIRKVCWAYAADPTDREDLYQEIAMRLLSAAKNYDASRTLSTWIYRVALNVAIESLRKRRHRHRIQLGLLGDTVMSPDSDMIIQLQELRDILEQQTEIDRALLLMSLEGNSYKEIAEILGINESNVGTRLNRLKNKLKQSLSTEVDHGTR